MFSPSHGSPLKLSTFSSPQLTGLLPRPREIKIKKIEDNTAEHVEILIHLPSGISPDKTIDALYAFTNCEVSIAPLACSIHEDTPLFIGVKDVLKRSTETTKGVLKAGRNHSCHTNAATNTLEEVKLEELF